MGAKICVDPDWDRWGWLNACGMAWLRGAPRFDAADQTIRIVGLHYDGAGAGLMLRLVRMMMGARLADALQSHLVFDETREIGRLKEQVTLALAEPRGARSHSVGACRHLLARRLYLDRDGISGEFFRDGEKSARNCRSRTSYAFVQLGADGGLEESLGPVEFFTPSRMRSIADSSASC